jgi:hypothetical protein
MEQGRGQAESTGKAKIRVYFGFIALYLSAPFKGGTESREKNYRLFAKCVSPPGKKNTGLPLAK